MTPMGLSLGKDWRSDKKDPTPTRQHGRSAARLLAPASHDNSASSRFPHKIFPPTSSNIRVHPRSSVVHLPSFVPPCSLCSCMFYFQLFIRVVCRFNVGRRPVPPWGGKEAPGGGRRE